MSDLVGVLRAIVREELARRRPPELGSVTQVHARTGDDDKSNHQVNVKLRASSVELQRVPVIVPRLGWSALPNEGDLVVVDFMGGDLNAPVVVGCVYDDQAHPPVAQLHEVVYQPPDEADSNVRRFHFELSNGATITADDEKLSIAFGDTTLEIQRDGDVSISAKGNLRLGAQGDIEVEAQGDLKLSSAASLSIKGMSVAVEGQSDTKVKGPQLTLAGVTQFSPS